MASREVVRGQVREASLQLIRALEDLHGMETMLPLAESVNSAALGIHLENALRRVRQATKEVEAAHRGWKALTRKVR